jgi:hypothetical protein
MRTENGPNYVYSFHELWEILFDPRYHCVLTQSKSDYCENIGCQFLVFGFHRYLQQILDWFGSKSSEQSLGFWFHYDLSLDF